MNKELLEALERLAMPDELHIKECEKLGIGLTEDYDIVKKALLELESIKEAKPSEALECLENYINNIIFSKDLISQKQQLLTNIAAIKQSLLKAEEEHNSVNLLMKELACKDFAELRKYARCGYESLNKE